MKNSPQIRFRDIEHADALQGLCEREIEKLERYYDRITTCRVVVQRPNHRHRQWLLKAVTMRVM